jgi:proline dehydrogenase
MALMRNALLWGSENKWLERQFRTRSFARIAVSRFMPGEDAPAAISAAASLASKSITAILTRLGENVTSPEGVADVVQHYLDVFDQIADRQLDAHISIKLTQLGLDVDPGAAYDNLLVLLDRATARRNFLWVDMEQSKYVDATLDIYKGARRDHPNIGVCLQAYLHRTVPDLESLLALDATIRLVKGAYNEPPEVAMARKSQVDARYLDLARRLLDHEAQRGEGGAAHHAIATHDLDMLNAVHGYAVQSGYGPTGYEVDMLYGIRTGEQERIAHSGVPMRVLISYGESWFPWYMRRLAERPANVGFVVRSMFMR